MNFVRSYKTATQRLYSTSPIRLLNRVFVSPDECSIQDSGRKYCHLPGMDPRCVHMKDILKVEIGDTLKVGVLNEGICDGGTVVEVDRSVSGSGITLEIGSLTPTSRPKVSLILTVPRPLRLKKIIPVLGNLGIHKLILTGAKDVPNDYFGSQLLKNENQFRQSLIEGLSQSAMDCIVPEVLVRRNLWAFITKEADSIFPPKFLRVVAHPMKAGVETPFEGEIQRLLKVHRSENAPEQEVVIAIGGEGGWHDNELKLLHDHRFHAAHMGPRILRSDTAVCAAVTLGHELIESWN